MTSTGPIGLRFKGEDIRGDIVILGTYWIYPDSAIYLSVSYKLLSLIGPLNSNLNYSSILCLDVLFKDISFCES